MTSAASGMRARMESLDLLANNIANSATTAFKADREFYNVYVSEQARNSDHPDLESPLIERRWTDFSQGTLVNTGNPLDLAITSRGFFAIDSESGPLYTRNGNFRLGLDGQIEAQDGGKLQVRTADGKPMRLDSAKPIDVAPDGTVRQDGQVRGQIRMFDFDDPNALSKRGSTYFQWLRDEQPSAITPALRQGVIESSNVPTAESAVRLVSVMRQFEMLQRAVSLGGEMNRRAIDDVAKVS